MKTAILASALALSFASLPATANEPRTVVAGDHKCDVRSDWDVSTHRRAFVFTRDGHVPKEIGIGGGRLFVDGKEMRLGAADHARLSQLERELHAAVPQLQQLVVEAVDIAFVALAEVARGLASEPDVAIADLRQAQRKVRAQLDARPLSALDGDAVAEVIRPILTEYVPQIVGGAVKGAVKAAFGGEQGAQDFEKKMQRMEQELDAKVELRAKQLEPLAEAMCQRMKTLDRIDDELEFRLPDGGRLELLRVGPRAKD